MTYIPYKLVIKKQGKLFEVDDPMRTGSPPVGRGRTMKEAFGDWVLNNLEAIDWIVDYDPNTWETCYRSRLRELKKR